MAIILITGGARSGKSVRAETRAKAFAGKPVYIATAEALDAEMRERIAETSRAARQRVDRARNSAGACPALKATDGGGARLVDCLTLWLSNLMHAQRDWSKETNGLPSRFARKKVRSCWLPTRSDLVSCPTMRWRANSATRRGSMNQMIAQAADEVEFVVAGLPVRVK